MGNTIEEARRKAQERQQLQEATATAAIAKAAADKQKRQENIRANQTFYAEAHQALVDTGIVLTMSELARSMREQLEEEAKNSGVGKNRQV